MNRGMLLRRSTMCRATFSVAIVFIQLALCCGFVPARIDLAQNQQRKPVPVLHPMPPQPRGKPSAQTRESLSGPSLSPVSGSSLPAFPRSSSLVSCEHASCPPHKLSPPAVRVCATCGQKITLVRPSIMRCIAMLQCMFCPCLTACNALQMELYSVCTVRAQTRVSVG